jgi:hypothetical protein
MARARIQDPILFSAYFGVPSDALDAAGLIDPFLDVDVPLFLDPVLLEKSINKTINTTAIARFRKHFEILVRMLTISKAENDAAWKGARRQLDLREPPENGLGYGGSGRSGSSRPKEIREAILRTSKALRKAAMGSPTDFDFFLTAVKENVVNYDPNLDALGYYRLKAIIANGFPGLKQTTPYNLTLGSNEIMRVVKDTIAQFKRHVEAGNLWEELWIDDKPKKERASQLIYYAIADAFCKANNLDISPEANMGGGPIDFKFSTGYQARVLVEMKRSGGTVVHGYEKQLEFYKTASQTDFAVFVIINYGDLGDKLNEITRIRDKRLRTGARASEIVVIDATRKASASKRR